MSNENWMIVELLGHVRLAGRVSEEERFGSKLGRIDIPVESKCLACAGFGSGFMDASPCPACNGAKIEVNWTTQYFGGGSVFRITIVSEDVARHVARTCNPVPVAAWEFPKPALAYEERSGRRVMDGGNQDDCLSHVVNSALAKVKS